MRRFSLIFLLLCSALWARPNMYIAPVELEGVHQDYADKIVRYVKNYMSEGGSNSFVDDVNRSDYILQIRLAKDEMGYGVIVSLKLLDPGSRETVWSYSSIAYTPQDFDVAANAIRQKFGKWSGFKLGVGLGAAGMAFSEFHTSPMISASMHYMFQEMLLSLEFNFAKDLTGDYPDMMYLAPDLSFAYVFGGHSIYPFAGGGGGYALTEYYEDEYFLTSGDVALHAKMGLIFKPLSSKKFYVLDIRYIYNIVDLGLYVERDGRDLASDKYAVSHGFNASVQVWW